MSNLTRGPERSASAVSIWLFPLAAGLFLWLGAAGGTGCVKKEGPTAPDTSNGMNPEWANTIGPNDTLFAPGTSVIRLSGLYYLPPGRWSYLVTCENGSRLLAPDGSNLCGLPTQTWVDTAVGRQLKAFPREPGGQITIQVSPGLVAGP